MSLLQELRQERAALEAAEEAGPRQTFACGCVYLIDARRWLTICPEGLARKNDPEVRRLWWRGVPGGWMAEDGFLEHLR